MSGIRPAVDADIPAVADMFQRILRKEKRPVPPALETYLGALFGDAARTDPELVSKVHLRDDGRVSGFLGVLPLPMEIAGRKIRAAVCGTFMVDAHEDDPFAGARLLRDVLSGPQDLSFSETSNDISTAMWRKMRARVMPDYSLEWLRVMRPASFMLEMASSRAAALRFLKPVVAPFDGILARGKETQSWAAYRPLTDKADALADEDAAEEDLAKVILELLASFVLRPHWSEEALAAMLAHARRKANHGARVQRIVRTRSGKPVGLFIYYGDPGRIGRVAQIMAVPGQEGAVIDRLLKHAHERRMVAMRGRTQPALLDAMIGRKFAFVHASSTVVHCRDPELLQPFYTGTAFVNGLAGEGWTRLIGDRFD